MIMTYEGKPYFFPIAVSEIEAMLEFAKKHGDECGNIIVVHRPSGILDTFHVADRNKFNEWHRNQPNYNRWSFNHELSSIPEFMTEITDWDLA